MRKKILAAMTTAVLMLLFAPQSAFAAKPGHTCSPGFDLGALTLEQELSLPNVQAGLAAGVYDMAFVAAFHQNADRNGDGLLCFKSFPSNANDASLLQYFYNVVDNNASVPSG